MASSSINHLEIILEICENQGIEHLDMIFLTNEIAFWISLFWI